MAIQAVLFDIGGVLIHTELEAYAQRAAQLFGSTPEAVREAALPRIPKLERGEITSETFWKEIGEVLWSKGLGQIPETEAFRGLWKDLLQSSLKLDSHVLRLCWSLRSKAMVGALSNTIQDHADHLADIGYYQPFHPCILSCMVGQRKPEPAMFKLAARLTGRSASKILLIDDSPLNCQAARSAGMKAHHFTGLKLLMDELFRWKLV